MVDVGEVNTSSQDVIEVRYGVRSSKQDGMDKVAWERGMTKVTRKG